MQFKQHPSSTWTTFWRPLLHYIPAPACCSGYIFLHRHFLQSLLSGFLDLSYSTPSSRLWGKPCTVSSASHSPSLLEPVPIQPSLTCSHCVSFRLHYSPACNSSQFSISSTFSPRTCFLFFTCHSKMKTKGGPSTSSPTFHSLLLLECTLIVILY